MRAELSARKGRSKQRRLATTNWAAEQQLLLLGNGCISTRRPLRVEQHYMHVRPHTHTSVPDQHGQDHRQHGIHHCASQATAQDNLCSNRA